MPAPITFLSLLCKFVGEGGRGRTGKRGGDFGRLNALDLLIRCAANLHSHEYVL